MKPINDFQTDFARVPRKFVSDADISVPNNRATNLNAAIESRDYEKIIALLTEVTQTSDSNELLEVDAFIPYLRSELLKAGLDVKKFDRSLRKARLEADAFTESLEQKNKE